MTPKFLRLSAGENANGSAMAKRLKRPRDPVQLAKLIGDIATGKVADKPPNRKSLKAPKAKRTAKPRKG